MQLGWNVGRSILLGRSNSMSPIIKRHCEADLRRLWQSAKQIAEVYFLGDENSNGTTLITSVFSLPVRIKDSRGDEKVNDELAFI